MNRDLNRKISLLVLIWMLFSVTCIPAISAGAAMYTSSTAIDLKNWNFDEDGIYKLKGFWELYPNRMIYHEDFLRETNLGNNQLVELPIFFVKSAQNNKGSNREYGTLRTTIKIAKEDVGKKLSIKSTFFYMNVAIFADGEALGSMGEISRKSSFVFRGSSNLISTFTPQKEEVELIIHYSQKDFVGSTYGEITIGKTEEIQNRIMKNLINDTFVFGVFVILAIFNLAFFLRHNRRKATERLAGYFTLMTILIIIRLLNSGEHYLLYWAPNLPSELFSKMNYWSYYLLLPYFVLFVNEVRKDLFTPLMIKVSRAVLAGLGLLVLMTNYGIYNRIMPIIWIYAVAVMIELLICVFRSLKMREGILKTDLISGFFMLLAFVCDSLYISGWYQTRELYLFFTMFFVIYVTYSVAKVYAASVDKLENYLVEHERLSGEIKTLESSYIRNLSEKQLSFETMVYEKEMRLGALEKVASVIEGAMAILDRQLRVVEVYGVNGPKHFEAGFENQLFLKYFLGEQSEEGRLFADILQRVLYIENPERIATYLSLLPKMTYKQGRWYRLTTTLVHDTNGNVQNLVVLIRDVSKLAYMTQQMEKYEMDARLLKTFAKYEKEVKYLIANVTIFVEKGIDQLYASGKDKEDVFFEVLSTLERYAIWYKVLGFEKTYIQYRAFIKELDRLDKEDAPFDKESLIRRIKNSGIDAFDVEDRKYIQAYVGESLKLERLEYVEFLSGSQELLPRLDIMKRYCSVLSELFGKTIEPLKIEGMSGKMSVNKISVLVTAISRIFDSIIVHHIEYYDERAKANKSLAGHIEMEVYKDLSNLIIEIKDDGSGININTLKDSLYKLNLLSFKEIVNAEEQAMLPYIFEKGIYYKETDNEFFGIGDGLRKVKQDIEGIGGSISVAAAFQSYCKFTIRLPLEEMVTL